MASETEHAAAVRAALDGPLGKWAAYDYDDVPGTSGNLGVVPNLYAIVTVTRRFGDDLRFSQVRNLVGYRLTTMAVGRTVDEARWVRARIAEAVSDQRLTIAGDATTAVKFESESPIQLDDGMYSGMTAWTYAV